VSFLIAHSKFLHGPRSHVPPLRGSTGEPGFLILQFHVDKASGGFTPNSEKLF